MEPLAINISLMLALWKANFIGKKTVYHPHTNMAKAALNMMTRTISPQFAKIRILMTAVDTGFITNELPIPCQGTKKQKPPLDEWDGAMRVLDPVFKGINGRDRVWGCFLKDYVPTNW